MTSVLIQSCLFGLFKKFIQHIKVSGPIFACFSAITVFQSPAIWKSFTILNISSFNLFAISLALCSFSAAHRSEHFYKVFFLAASLASTNLLSLVLTIPLVITVFIRGQNGKRYSFEIMQIIVVGLWVSMITNISFRFDS